MKTGNPMKLILLALFIALPFLSFAQGYRIRVGTAEYDSDKVPEQGDYPQRVNKFFVKKMRGDREPKTYIVQVGEEEYTFKSSGDWQEVKFTHDVKDLMVHILDENRRQQGRSFTLRKRK
jgi:hypothetical protein